jgi:hypothetical protein
VFILGFIMIIGAIVANILVMARMNGCDDNEGMVSSSRAEVQGCNVE